MAIAQSDGSIVLTTKVDTTGINKGVSHIKGAVSSASKAFATFGSIITASLSVTAFINFSREAGEMATQQEANIQRLIDIYGEASKTLGDFIDTNARAIGMSKSAAASFSAVYGNLFSVWADQNTNAALTEKYLNMTAVVASKSGRTVEDVQERVRSGLLGNTEAIEDLGIFVNVKTIEMTEAFQRMADSRSWEQLGAYEQQQIRTLSILEQATQKYGEEVAETSALIRAEAKAAYEDLQATWGQFVNVVLMPVLEVATQVMNIITLGLQTIAQLTGKTISDSISSSTENQNKLTDAVKETNKELKKSVASFDTIEILSNKTADSTANKGAASGGLGSIFDEDMTASSKAQDTVSDALLGVMAVAGLSLAAIGIVLIATGHLAWGVGLLLAGIAIFGVAAATLKSDAISQQTKDALSNVIIIAGIVAVVLGILCCVAKRFDIGIGLIVLGVAAIVSAVALNWDSIKVKVSEGIDKVGQWIEDWGKLVLGVLLCLSGVGIPLGLALIKDGAATLAESEDPQWSAIGIKIQEVIDNISLWLESWGSLVLGVILCLSAIGIPLGITLIKNGVESLEEAEDPKWETIKEKITTVFDEIFDWLLDFGMLVLGVMLCLAGVSIPIGIALIAAGAGNLIENAEDVDWDSMSEKITEWFEDVSSWLENYGRLILGVILCLSGIAIPQGIVLIKEGAKKLSESEDPKWQTIGDKIQEVFDKILNWLKTWGLLVLGVILCFTGVGIPLGLGLMKKGAANLSASESPLWDTMLEKIKSTWGKIKEYWKNNCAKYFTAEWWGNLAKNAVNGLLRWFVNGINKLIEKLNSFGFTLPEVLGGKRVGFNIQKLQIPQLAKGAVLPANHPFLAVVGDQKH
jgi:hypothetical protein